MERFIIADIDLINRKMADLIGSDESTMRAEVRILTSTIIAVREYADEEDDEINPNMCMVYLTSGEFFILHTPYAEMLQILDWN